MSKILKGDRIIVIEPRFGLTAGKVYTARTDEAYGEVQIMDDAYSLAFRKASRFLKVDETLTPKVGDSIIVRIGNGSDRFKAGELRTVDAVTGDFYPTIKVSGSSAWWDAARFAVIAKDKAPAFKAGDRVQVSPDAAHYTKGAIGVVERYKALKQTAYHVTPSRESDGYYTVRTDAGTTIVSWDFDLTPYAPTFKVGDRVERTGDKHFTNGYKGFDYTDGECKHGDTGTVHAVKPYGAVDGYRVEWDKGRSSIISGQCLKAGTPKPIPAPIPAPVKATPVPKFKTGDKVTVNAKGIRRKGETGYVTEVHNAFSGSHGDFYYIVDFIAGGVDHGGLWENFLTPAGFKNGDKVIVTEARWASDKALEGKPATYDREHLYNKGTHRVRFANGTQAFVKGVAPYDASKVRFRDLEAAEQDAKRKAGKIAKLQSLAKELGYDVYPVAS